MKTLTEIVCALVEMMEETEQKGYLEKMAQSKRPTKPPRPLTVGEKWWHGKLNLKHSKEWITDITPSDLLDDYIERTGWTKTRHGAATSMGTMLRQVCPNIRRHNGKYLIPNLEQARKAFLEEFPMPRRAPQGGSEKSGIPTNPLKYRVVD